MALGVLETEFGLRGYFQVPPCLLPVPRLALLLLLVLLLVLSYPTVVGPSSAGDIGLRV